MDYNNILENDKYVIINKGTMIHADLCGRFVHGSKASVAFKHGYQICPTCNALYLNTRGEQLSEKEHLNSAIHKKAIAPHRRISKRFN
jgi:hypothetical protein